MRVTIGGVRGSFPVARRDTVRYGGETTSVLVEAGDGACVLLDLGSGVARFLSQFSGRDPARLTVLMTHYHLDHLIGLPALPVLYQDGSRIEFAAPLIGGCTVESALRRFLAPPFWPLDFDRMPAQFRFTSLADTPGGRPLRRGGFRIRWCALHHPSGCVAYRIDEPAAGASLVFATDLEWSLSSREEKASFLAFAAAPCPPDLLMFDAHVPPAGQSRYRHWGHSTWREAGEVGRAIGAGSILGIHHAPDHSDTTLDAISARFRSTYPEGRLARAGRTIRIGS